LGCHVWCEVKSRVLRPKSSVLLRARRTLESQSRQQLDRMSGSKCLSSKTSQYALCTFTPGCMENTLIQQSLETPTETDTQQQLQLQHLIEMWSVTSKASLIKRLISGKIVLMRVLKPKTNTLNICYDVFLRNFMTFKA